MCVWAGRVPSSAAVNWTNIGVFALGLTAAIGFLGIASRYSFASRLKRIQSLPAHAPANLTPSTVNKLWGPKMSSASAPANVVSPAATPAIKTALDYMALDRKDDTRKFI